jgi:uncharacterized protein (TIGR03086 family)
MDAAARYRRIADEFTARVTNVPEDAWDRPAPCDGWRARDVVGHLVGWMPGLFLGNAGIPFTPGPSVEEDPAAAWAATDRALQAVLEDSELSARELDLPPGRMTLSHAIDMLGTSDVLIHTWDLARATGLDEHLLEDEVGAMLEGIQPMDEVLRNSGHYGPKVPVPEDADEQTRLLAFLGRRP